MVNSMEGGRDWREEEMGEREILKKGKDWKDGGTEWRDQMEDPRVEAVIKRGSI